MYTRLIPKRKRFSQYVVYRDASSAVSVDRAGTAEISTGLVPLETAPPALPAAHLYLEEVGEVPSSPSGSMMAIGELAGSDQGQRRYCGTFSRCGLQEIADDDFGFHHPIGS